MNRTDDTLKMLQQGIEELYESEKYRKYLDTMSQFHSYSVNNCILISMQKPDATHVAGYTAWKEKFHRQVIKGSKGITIISPTPYRKTVDVEVKDAYGKPVLDSNGQPVTEKREIKHQGFKAATVFDISQTTGEPLPTITQELLDPVEGFMDYMDAIRDLSPVPIRYDEIQGSAKGYYSPQNGEIVIQRGMSEEQTIKTALHEVAHARLGHGTDRNKCDRHTREVQAESIAYCCCRAIGLDTSEYSFGYIAGWSSGKDAKELKESLHVIRQEADRMITGIEQGIKPPCIEKEKLAVETPQIKHKGIRMAM